jgi:quinol monooxygenase YgiN
MTQQIVIAGTISIPPDKRATCLEDTAHLQRATRDDEPGCLAYVFSADPLQPDAITVFELWADAASLEAHFLHPNYTNMRAALGAHGITGANVLKYRIDAAAPVYNAQRIATASFE